MQTAQEKIVSAIKAGQLPNNIQDIIGDFLDAEGNKFELQEGTHWDYKQSFPFSFTDDYFGGILRLICAFHNTYGGIIIFGVHDTKRTAGHNSVRVDIEKLNTRIREVLSSSIECIHKSYSLVDQISQKEQAIDIILVPKRPMSIRPVYFSKDIGRYKQEKIWLRRGHEVLEASSQDLMTLYGARSSYGIYQDIENETISSCLPKSPATLREFVGRVKVMDQLFNWLIESDEPRTFLYGKGGSGKSTIAHEFAKIVAEQGRNLLVGQENYIDQVIFLSAKKRELNPITGKTQDFIGTDFANAEELFGNILEFSEWMPSAEIASLDRRQLEAEIRSLLDTQFILLIVDDVDTLTTQKLDPGIDFLYKASIKAKRGAKVLYTLRNAPSHSLGNSIEVPGLSPDGEYQEFIGTCCKQFRQPLPSAQIADTLIAECSERRPLVIEVIIGLRRTSGNYENAVTLFKTQSGDDARRYLFDREYIALPPDNRARYLLAALALFGKPASFSDLEAVLRVEKQQISDALGQVVEMFLQTSETGGGETLYTLGDVTRAYILEVSVHLDRFALIKERTSAYIRTFHPRQKEISLMRAKAESYMARNNPELAWGVVAVSDLDPKISEHPEYKMLLARIASVQRPPKIDVARDAFEYCASMAYEDTEGMKAWFSLEKESGFGFDRAVYVCKKVIEGKSYSKKEKAEFLVRLGSLHYHRGRNNSVTNITDAVHDLENALVAHLKGFSIGLTESSFNLNRASEYARNTAFSLFNVVLRAGDPSLAGGALDRLAREKDIFCDPVKVPMMEFAQNLPQSRDSVQLSKRKSFLHKMKATVLGKSPISFDETTCKEEIGSAIEDAIRRINGKMSDSPIS